MRSRRLGCSQPERFFKAFKRDLAAEYRSPARVIEGKEYSSEAIAEIFLNEIWQQLKLQNLTPSQIIFTVPVGGFENYSYWCREVANKLGIEKVQLKEILETQQLLSQLRNCLDDIISMAMTKGINKKQIEKVILVGGSCLIAPVRELIISFFGREKVLINKPFEAVSHGALTLSLLESIDDHLYHSYAIRTWNPLTQENVYNPLFASGLQYPCELAHPLILQCANNGQDAIYLDIGQVVEMGKAELSYDSSGKMTSGVVKSP